MLRPSFPAASAHRQMPRISKTTSPVRTSRSSSRSGSPWPEPGTRMNTFRRWLRRTCHDRTEKLVEGCGPLDEAFGESRALPLKKLIPPNPGRGSTDDLRTDFLARDGHGTRFPLTSHVIYHMRSVKTRADGIQSCIDFIAIFTILSISYFDYHMKIDTTLTPCHPVIHHQGADECSDRVRFRLPLSAA
jgi:hypothetical protein